MATCGRCPTCGRGIDADSGECPACLLNLALQTSSGGDEAPPTTPATRLAAGERVGPYTVVRELGEGGMGIVYLAEQVEPIRRRVALKVVKHGMDTEQVVRRFEAERQALALMDHVAIARVYEAGETAAGRPYFAMEFVDGEPITEFADRRRLDTAARLELFARVCDGLQHAHQRGIIHRDIKPSNVLVGETDESPQPKIIDFGVAKATEQSLTGRSALTALGVLLGTPEYMSPEQADLAPFDVDTRTDVYSLGVVLYELLTGVPPLEARRLEAAGFDEIRRHIREVRPPRPSTRLGRLGERAAAAATARRSDARSLRRRLSGDLDLIAMKALEKERDRRYGSPAELAADIRRHLARQPILARPPSFAYHVRKAMERNRLAAGLAVAIVALAVGAAAMSVVQQGRTRAQRDRAEREAQTAREVSEFLTGLFAGADPRVARGREITLHDVVGLGAERVESELAGQPVVQARLLLLLGGIHRQLGEPDEALRLLERARELGGDEAREDPRFTVDLHTTLAWVHRDAGRLDEALEAADRAVSLAEADLRRGDPLRLDALTLSGAIRRDRGEFDEARATLGRALDLAQAEAGERSAGAGWVWFHLGWLEHQLGRDEEAVAAYERACPILEASLERHAPGVATCYSDYSNVLQALRRYDEAREKLTVAIDVWRRVLPEDHPRIADAHNSLGSLAYFAEDLDGAEEHYRAALAIQRDALGEDHPDVGGTIFNLGLVARQRGRLDEAEGLMEDGLAVMEAARGPDHPSVVNALFALAPLHERRGRLEKAAEAYARAVASRERTHGPDHPWTAGALRSLAKTRLWLGRYDSACEAYGRADTIAAAHFPAGHRGSLEIALESAACEALRGETDRATAIVERVESAPERADTEDALTAYAAYVRARIALAEGRAADADAAMERALHIRRAIEQQPSYQRLYVEAMASAHRGDLDRAVETLRSAVASGLPPHAIDYEVDFSPLAGRAGLP